MGASNVMAAYALYAGRVPATSMQVLVYMAAVAKDSDRKPWFSQGSRALAEHALGRPAPVTASDLRAVERALAPLAAIGAIVTDRRAAVRADGGNTARYRLMLDPTDAPRNSSGVNDPEPPDASTPIGNEDPPRPTKNGADARRKVVARPTKSGRTPDEKRGAKELEELEEREEEEHLGVTTDRTVSRARASPGRKCPTHPFLKADSTADDGTPECSLCRRSQPPPPTQLRVIQGGIA